ncbi:hypothetical protein HZC27_05215 [Candidatus Roizmanbacteria bacterium]|nr:hypothetical protein [Candidatus Roizmanbacteria bacterium]
MEQAVEYMEEMQGCLEDPVGLIALVGSMRGGRTLNPNTSLARWGNSPDKESDTDFILVDKILFEKIKQADPYDILPERKFPKMGGRKTYGLVDRKNGKIKRSLQKASPQLSEVIRKMMGQTGRIMDIGVYRDRQAALSEDYASGISLVATKDKLFL